MSGSIRSSSEWTRDHEVNADVCIIGSGAGGSVLAAGLCAAGLDVVMLEEGGHHTVQDFRALDEAVNTPMLYQERGTRATSDLAITILQGRSVGGGTTINWTTCFRTPDRILAHWRRHHGLEAWTPSDLRPHFEAVEQRLHIHRWKEELLNGNNQALWRGCHALGWEAEVLRRNVKGCANSGYCGFGCPFDAKQAMHLTFLPDAVAAGLQLWADTRAERIEVEGGRAVAVHAVAMDPDRDRAAGHRLTVRAKVIVSSGGAINGPALLLRSGLSQGPVGRRTFLHPVIAVAGAYDERISPWYGAPQSASSHQFIERGPEHVGFFMEACPLHPSLTGGAFPLFGEAQLDVMCQLAHTSALLALHVDGLVEGDDGGVVSLRGDGRVAVDYPVRAPLIEAMRASHEALCRVHLAAGATEARTLHLSPVRVSEQAHLARLDTVPYGAHEHAIFTAHQMGGCAMGASAERSVVDSDLRHHHVPNLFCVDGSVFPTALGVNPSESIYGLAHRARKAVGEAV